MDCAMLSSKKSIYDKECCAFYLSWWLIAFKPEGAVKGFKSGLYYFVDGMIPLLLVAVTMLAVTIGVTVS